MFAYTYMYIIYIESGWIADTDEYIFATGNKFDETELINSQAYNSFLDSPGALASNEKQNL